MRPSQTFATMRAAVESVAATVEKSGDAYPVKPGAGEDVYLAATRLFFQYLDKNRYGYVNAIVGLPVARLRVMAGVTSVAAWRRIRQDVLWGWRIEGGFAYHDAASVALQRLIETRHGAAYRKQKEQGDRAIMLEDLESWGHPQDRAIFTSDLRKVYARIKKSQSAQSSASGRQMQLEVEAA